MPALMACSDPDECGEGLGKPDYSLDNPKPRSTGASLELAGAVASRIRLKSFTIAEVAVAGTDNYSTWKVTIPANVVEKYRIGNTSTLPVAIVDACGVVTEPDAISVHAEAEAGTSAEELAVSLESEECFLPADGSRKTEVVVRAALSAVGVRVGLKTSGGTLLGARESDGTVVLANGDGNAQARAFLHTVATADGLASVTANAGTTFDFTPTYPIAVAPRFTGQAGVTNGKPAFINVATAGRLRSCSASSTVSGSAVFSSAKVAAIDILNAEDELELDVAGCGQSALFKVEFAAGVPAGALLTLACADHLDQTSTYLVTSQGDPAPATP